MNPPARSPVASQEEATRPPDPELVAALVPLFDLFIQIDRRVKREKRERGHGLGDPPPE